MNQIEIKKQFNAPVAEVFALLSKHDSYNLAFAPLQVERIQTSTDVEYPDAVGSVRRLGWGKIKPLKEQITVFELNQRIEYQIVDSRLVKHHIGRLEFVALNENTTLVTYTIELQTRLPWISHLILAQLKTAIKLGLSKLAKTL